MMYIALKTIILEDCFGRDNQYLRGHKYDLTYSDWDIVHSNGRIIQGYSTVHILSKEDIEQYFEYEEPELLRGSRGNRVFKVKQTKEDS